MTKTKYYDLQMDDPQDDYDVDVVNANLKKIDEQMKTRENATDALQEPEFTVAAKRENIASKEKMPKILGKIAKFFADLKTVAFSGKYNDLDGKPAIVNNNTTTEPGSALDARQANPNIEGTMAASIAQINSNLTFENSPMVLKKYNLAKNGSITIPCLNCIIFFVGHLASHFLIATTVGYQSDSIRSRVSFVNGNEQIGVTIAYSKEDTLEAYSGKFTISNTRDSMDVIVIGIKNYSKV
jgi:hypothetical protein|nr:MAG TPA: hypothetical protein [Caudoviricetes sp.]DAK81019.1 MAG TPA: hypothetical protein [Caudoviricetes sp.]